MSVSPYIKKHDEIGKYYSKVSQQSKDYIFQGLPKTSSNQKQRRVQRLAFKERVRTFYKVEWVFGRYPIEIQPSKDKKHNR
jgi:hypothetical protein